MSEHSSGLHGVVDVVLQTILDTTTDMIFVKDMDLVYLGASWSFARLVGRRSPSELIGKTDHDLFSDPKLAARYVEDDRAMLKSGEALLPYVEPLPAENGRPRYSLTTKRILRDPHGAPLGLLGIGRDITQEYEAKLNYERELRYLFELPADALSAILLDITDWRIVDVRVQPGKADKLPLYTSVEDYLKHVKSAIVDGNEAVVRFFDTFTRDWITGQYDSGKRRAEVEYFRRMSDGSALWVRNEFTMLIDPVSGHLTLLALLRDLTAHKLAERELTRAAEQDAMTALYNREATMKHIAAFLTGAGARGRHALFMIDIDNFKQINDTFGHQTGDGVITDIAGVIKRIFRESDVVGRVGGDEFFALMKQAPDDGMICKKATELVEALQYVCTAAQSSVELTASVGISVYEGDRKPLDTLYAEVDAALYQAKQHGKNSYVLYGAVDTPQQHGRAAAGREPSSALQLRSLLKNMDGEMFLIEVDGGLRTVFSSRGGVKVNTLAGMENDNVYLEDQTTLQAAFLRCAKTGEPLDLSYRVAAPGGAVWRHLKASRLQESADAVPRILCVVTDITALKKNEEKLAFAELRYRTAAEESGLLLWHVDLREKTLTFYGAAARGLGLAGQSFPDPIHTRVASGAVHPQSASEFMRMYQDIYAGRESSEYTIISIGADGSEFAARAHYSLLRDKAGQPYLAVGTSVPLLLNQELSLYRKLSHGGVFSARADGSTTLLYGNDRCFALLGYTRESFRELHGNRGAEIIHPADFPGVRAAFADAVREKVRECLFNLRVLTAEGETRHLEVSGEIEHMSDGYYVVNGVVIDVTQQKLAELAQKKQQQALTAQYDKLMSLRDSVEDTLVCTNYLNLTRNVLTRCIAHESRMDGLCDAADADAYFVLASACFCADADRRAFAAAFNRQGLLAAFSEGQTLLSFEGRCRVAPDTVLWLEFAAAMAENPATGDIECVVYARNIDEKKKTGFMIERLLESDYEYLCRVDANGRVVSYGSAPQAACSYDEMAPVIVSESVAPEYADEALRALGRPAVLDALRTHRTYTRVFPGASDENGMREYRSWTFAYLDAQHQDFLMSRANVTALFVGERDALSGLYNRQAFYRRVRAALDENPTARFVMVRCDIDRFKAYNETFGIPAGDRLLGDLGRQILSGGLAGGIAGRIEADHFALLLPAEPLDISGWYQRLSTWLSRYSDRFHLSCSVGVYEIADPRLDVSLMCDRAMLALHTVKQSYANKIAWYNDSLRQQLMDEQKLIDDMADAMDDGQFVLYFQPQVNYDDGTLIGAEALVRWQHPTRGLIQPGSFIPLFEKNGFIARLDEYVWEQACIAMRRWRDEEDKLLPVSVSVNVSRFDIYQADLGDRLTALVERYGLPPSALKLEITESAYMDNPRLLLSFVRSMQTRGFTVEMDDFGAGYSSLNTLKNVPVDVLKLNVEFLADSDGDARGGNILSSVIRMAHWLKLPVVAEGVETRVQADYLKSLGCIFMQGYYFDRPLPAAEFELLLRRARLGDLSRYRKVDLKDMVDFWDPSSQTTLLFNSLVGGAAILEHAGAQMELVRINDGFFSEIGMARKDCAGFETLLKNGLRPADLPVFAGMLQSAAAGDGTAECEIRFRSPSHARGTVRLHCRVRLLAQNLDRSLYYLSVKSLTRPHTPQGGPA